MQQQIIQALLWPINDVPKIANIGTTGIGPAIPAIAELAVVAVPAVFRKPVGGGAVAEVSDIAIGYLIAAAISFVANRA